MTIKVITEERFAYGVSNWNVIAVIPIDVHKSIPNIDKYLKSLYDSEKKIKKINKENKIKNPNEAEMKFTRPIEVVIMEAIQNSIDWQYPEVAHFLINALLERQNHEKKAI